MALYNYGDNSTIKPLGNTTIHIESALSNKRDVDTGVTLYIPIGYQHSTITKKINNGVMINNGEIYVLKGV